MTPDPEVYIPDVCEYCKYESKWADDEDPCSNCCIEQEDYGAYCEWEPNTLTKAAPEMLEALKEFDVARKAIKSEEWTNNWFVEQAARDMISRAINVYRKVTDDKKD